MVELRIYEVNTIAEVVLDHAGEGGTSRPGALAPPLPKVTVGNPANWCAERGRHGAAASPLAASVRGRQDLGQTTSSAASTATSRGAKNNFMLNLCAFSGVRRQRETMTSHTPRLRALRAHGANDGGCAARRTKF